MVDLPARLMLWRAFNLFFTVFNVLIWVRIIFSFFRPSPYTIWDRIDQISWRLTEPILGPIRNLMPRTMMVDFSPMIALILMQLLQRILAQILF